MTRFEHVNSYAATPERVLAMLTDPGFREEVCVAQRAVEHTVAVDDGGAATVVEISRTQSLEGAPSLATRVVGHSIRFVQRETWDEGGAADLDITIPGRPGHVRGTVRLRATPDGCEQRVAAEVKIHVPLVGGRLEQFVAQILGKAMDQEARVGEGWLTRP